MSRPARTTTLRGAAQPLPRMGLGLAALGRPGYITLGHRDEFAAGRSVAAMETQSHAVLDAAWRLGIRYFDAARSYGKAEQFLGSWLSTREIDPDAVVVASKWGYRYVAQWQVDADQHEVKEHSLAMLRQQWQESHALLGDQLDLYQIHSATFESGVLANGAVLDGLARLKSEQGVRLGLSLSGPDQAALLRVAMGIEREGGRLFDGVQATWNLLEPSVGAALAEAHAVGMTVIVKEALANGRLTAGNDSPRFATQKARLQRVADRLGTTLDGLALAAVLAQPWADVVLSGATTDAQLVSNRAAFDVVWDDDAAATLAELAESPPHYWAYRSALPWH